MPKPYLNKSHEDVVSALKKEFISLNSPAVFNQKIIKLTSMNKTEKLNLLHKTNLLKKIEKKLHTHAQKIGDYDEKLSAKLILKEITNNENTQLNIILLFSLLNEFSHVTQIDGGSYHATREFLESQCGQQAFDGLPASIKSQRAIQRKIEEFIYTLAAAQLFSQEHHKIWQKMATIMLKIHNPDNSSYWIQNDESYFFQLFHDYFIACFKHEGKQKHPNKIQIFTKNITPEKLAKQIKSLIKNTLTPPPATLKDIKEIAHKNLQYLKSTRRLKGDSMLAEHIEEICTHIINTRTIEEITNPCKKHHTADQESLKDFYQKKTTTTRGNTATPP